MVQRETKPFRGVKMLILLSPKNGYFPKGLTHGFSEKNPKFFLICFSVK